MRGKKIRAPVSGKDELCQYTIRRCQTGIELVMECQQCGARDLSNPECFRGAVKAIQSQGLPSSIVLRSHIERRHDSRSTRIMAQIAEVINLVDGLQFQLSADSKRGERCANCLSPLIRELEIMKGLLMAKDLQNGFSLARNLEHHVFRTGVRCDECEGMARLQFASITKVAESLEKDILSGTINLMGETK